MPRSDGYGHVSDLADVAPGTSLTVKIHQAELVPSEQL